MIAHCCHGRLRPGVHGQHRFVLVHEGQVADLAVGQRHRRFQGKVGDLLQGGPAHLVQLHQGLQPRFVEPQFLLRAFLLAHVPEYQDHADDPAVSAGNGRGAVGNAAFPSRPCR